MSRRQTNIAPFSLFSFQDIITSVTGVIILVMLLLAVELVQRKTVAVEAASNTTPQVLSDQLSRLERQINDTRKTLQNGESFVAQIAGLSRGGILQQEVDLNRMVEQLSTETNQLAVAAARGLHDYGSAPIPEDLTRLQDDLVSAQASVDRLKTKLQSLEDSHQVIYNPNPFSEKTAWLVDLLPGAIRVAEPGKAAAFVEFADGAQDTAIGQFLLWSTHRDKRSEYFVILLRPKSIRLYAEIQKQLSERGFDSGVDLIESNATVMEVESEGT